MSILANSNAISTGGYDISNSLRFRSSASAYLSRTPASAGNRRTWTWSAWVKPSLTVSTYAMLFAAGSTNGASTRNYFGFDSSYRFIFGYGTADYRVSTQVFRDPSSWYHIVVVFDSSNATAQNRIRVYVNNVEITVWTTNNTVTLNQDGAINNNILHYDGAESGGYYFDGYLAEVNFIDGQALTPSSFGTTDATTGVWRPLKYAGTYGTNGFYLKFSDIATTSGSNAGLGKDFSGNSNYWTTNNISVTAGTTYDAMKDSPTLTSPTIANYCILNPIQKGSNVTISEANLRFSCGTSTFGSVMGSIAVSSGKWYWETIINVITDAPIFGIANPASLPANYPGSSAQEYSYYPFSAIKMNNNVQTSYGVTCTTGDIVGCALDLDNGKIWWSKNGTWMASGDPAAGTNAAYTGISGTKAPCIGDGSSGTASDISYNFGQRPFSYTPPTGFVALNTYNLPTSTILQGNKYMDATLYTGNGSAQSITTATGFKPDMVWIKSRSIVQQTMAIYDSIRGGNSTLLGYSANAQATDNNLYGGLSAFNSNGFSIVTGTDTNTANQRGWTNLQTYVAWQWQAGQGTTSSNTSGTITSTISVSPTAGFSIISYTGTQANGTIGHGLGVAPKFIICKSRTTGQNFGAWHTSMTAGYHNNFNTTSGQYLEATFFNGSVPSSTVISVGANTDINTLNATYILYAWAEISGFSKFGSYIGNASADGPFVYLGFRPKFVLIKRIDTTSSWDIFDTSRNTYNLTDLNLYANLTDADGASTSHCIDILSNGFKAKGTGTNINASSGTYVYAAFAENPFKYSNAR